MHTVKFQSGQESGHPFHPNDRGLATNGVEPVLWKTLIVSALACFIWSDDFSIQIGPLVIKKNALIQSAQTNSHSLFHFLSDPAGSGLKLEIKPAEYDLLTWAIDPGFQHRHHLDENEMLRARATCSEFTRRFGPVAIAEMRRSGVPASLLIAQALLASDAGVDQTAIETNNYFLRCQNHRSQAPVHARQSSCDVEHFNHLWGSFRAQTRYFQTEAGFRGLTDANFNTWIDALSRTGYSEDPDYPTKLRMIIRALRLDTLDAR